MAQQNPIERAQEETNNGIAADSSSSSTPSPNGDAVGTNSTENDLIPNDLRSKFIPFRNGYNIFSFRNRNPQEGLYMTNHIAIIPDDHQMFNEDIGMKQLASVFQKDIDNNQGKSTLETILNRIPAIQIREYQQETKAELLWSLIKYGIEGFKKGKDDSENSNGMTKDQLIAYGKIATRDLGSLGFWEDLGHKIAASFKSSASPLYNNENIETVLTQDVVHALYYRMIGQQTTNMYIFPYTSEDVFSTNGSEGWPGADPFGFGGTSKFGILGELLNHIGSNVKIVTQPIWRGNQGTPSGTVNIKITLFNDNYDHAIDNFVLVNTLFPNNMFTQYGIFQQPPSCYDIKIEGGRRWFMCSGNFKCTYKGVMRHPSQYFFDRLDRNFHNSSDNVNNLSKDVITKNRLITIPDAYELDLTFTSLLPDSFNNYVFQYSMNNHIWNYPSKQQAFYMEPTIKKWFDVKWNGVSGKAEKLAKEIANKRTQDEKQKAAEEAAVKKALDSAKKSE